VPERTRYQAINIVLAEVLSLNLAVAFAKLGLGYLTGAVSIVSDGIHSLTDSLSNVVALLGTRVARKPPDADHPYGHRKFETMSAAMIGAFLLVAMIELAREAWQRLNTQHAGPQVTTGAFLIMLGTLVVNVLVTTFERRAGNRLKSEVLLADATHTRSDIFTTLTVLVALAGAKLGYPLLDPMAAIVVVGFIGHAAWEIFKGATDVLGDRIVIAEDDVRAAVMTVPAVMGCHEIRTRGSADYVFLDLHVWMPSKTPLDQAHAVSHEVKDRLMARFPQIRDAVIHIEPPPREDDPRRG
jgi:cation diffusion facilitator family transporter